MRETVKDFSGKIIGYIDTDFNGNKIGYDFHHRIVGYYNRQRDVTEDFHHRIVFRGDALVSLVTNAK